MVILKLLPLQLAPLQHRLLGVKSIVIADLVQVEGLIHFMKHFVPIILVRNQKTILKLKAQRLPYVPLSLRQVI